MANSPPKRERIDRHRSRRVRIGRWRDTPRTRWSLGGPPGSERFRLHAVHEESQQGGHGREHGDPVSLHSGKQGRGSQAGQECELTAAHQPVEKGHDLAVHVRQREQGQRSLATHAGGHRDRAGAVDQLAVGERDSLGSLVVPLVNSTSARSEEVGGVGSCPNGSAVSDAASIPMTGTPPAATEEAHPRRRGLPTSRPVVPLANANRNLRGHPQIQGHDHRA